jgi:hypothetical protein
MTDYNDEYLTSPKKSFNVNEYAAHHGITVQAAWSKRKRAKARATVDPAITRAMSAIGTNMVPSVVWDKTQPGYSVLLRPSVVDAANVLELVKDAFTDIPAYRPNPIAARNQNLMTVYPVMDWHIGMAAWGKETGADDYDLSYAVSDMRAAFDGLDAITPASDHAVLILGGDTLHADDTRSETPQSKHKLDVDGRHFKVIDTAIKVICETIDRMAEKHRRITIRVLRGNHDIHSHLVLIFAIAERYRLAENIEIEKNPKDLFMIQHGTVLLAAHHGDKSPPQRLVSHIADVCPFWSDTRDRHVLTGHIHHDSTKDLGGIKWHSLRAFCPPDEYGSQFSSRRALTAYTFDDKKGLILTGHEAIKR